MFFKKSFLHFKTAVYERDEHNILKLILLSGQRVQQNWNSSNNASWNRIKSLGLEIDCKKYKFDEWTWDINVYPDASNIH